MRTVSITCDLCQKPTTAKMFSIVQVQGMALRNPFDVCPDCHGKPIADLVKAITPEPPKIAPRPPVRYVTPGGKPVVPDSKVENAT